MKFLSVLFYKITFTGTMKVLRFYVNLLKRQKEKLPGELRAERNHRYYWQ